MTEPQQEKSAFVSLYEATQRKLSEQQAIDLSPMADLRKWCLERAFETRALTGVTHMTVTNLAEEYYVWIARGESEASRLAPAEPNGASEH